MIEKMMISNIKTALSFADDAIALQVALLIAKLAGIISWPWLFVLTPMWVYFATVVTAVTAFTIIHCHHVYYEQPDKDLFSHRKRL